MEIESKISIITARAMGMWKKNYYLLKEAQRVTEKIKRREKNEDNI